MSIAVNDFSDQKVRGTGFFSPREDSQINFLLFLLLYEKHRFIICVGNLTFFFQLWPRVGRGFCIWNCVCMCATLIIIRNVDKSSKFRTVSATVTQNRECRGGRINLNFAV
mmetsp:Transcript_5828/g.15650  ORF Transcript_5828/g.15650 Transcript_5828/m.15650 type:complete len:111 (+) Transcript_5828:579-911(+)